MTDRFPFSDAFQIKLAATLLKDRKFWGDYLDKVEVAYFTDHTVGAVIGVQKSFKAKYGEFADAAALEEYYSVLERSTDKQEVFKERLEKVMEVDAASAKEFTRERLKEFLVMAALQSVMEDVLDEMSDKNPDRSIIGKFQKALSAGDVDDNDGLTWGEDARRVLKEELDPTIRGHVPTGIVHLDSCLGGGLRPGELGIVLAPPKGFKSGWLLNAGWGANLRGVGKRVDYLSLELSEELQMLRYCFKVTGMGRNELVGDPDRFLRVMDKRKRLLIDPKGEFRVKFMPPYACTPSKIRAYLDRQIERERALGVLIIDYLDLMGADEKKEKSYLEAVHICTDLRQIAIDYQIPVWTAARATREAVGRRKINMSHMAAAFERVAIADYVYALCHTDEEKLNNRMRIVPVATRNDGGDKIVECKWQPRIMSIRSIESRDMTDDDIDDGNGNSGFRGKNAEERKAKAKATLDELVKVGRDKAKKATE